MKLIKKTNKVLKGTLTSTLVMCILCIVFLMVCLGGSSWAWFSTSSNSSTYTISTIGYDAAITISKLNSRAKLFANGRTDDEELLHHQMIREPGSYVIGVYPKDGISGYCTLKITDEKEKVLLSKVIKVTKEEQPSFVIHTNRNLDINIENINWGALESYEELEEEYFFGDFSIEYDTGIEEYSLLPEGYQELSYIQSDENGQYIDDIAVDDVTYLTFKEYDEEKQLIFKELKIEKTEYKDEEGNVVSHIYPCVNKDGKDGIYDVVKDKFYENKTDKPFVRGEEIRHFRFNGVDVVCANDGKQTSTHSYSVDYEDKLLKHPEDIDGIVNKLGYHFDCWQYQNEDVDVKVNPEESIKSLVDAANPKDQETIVLKAVYKENANTVIFTDCDGKEILKETKTVSENIEIPEPEVKEGYEFAGYYIEDTETVADFNSLFNKTDNGVTVNICLRYTLKEAGVEETAQSEEPVDETTKEIVNNEEENATEETTAGSSETIEEENGQQQTEEN